MSKRESQAFKSYAERRGSRKIICPRCGMPGWLCVKPVRNRPGGSVYYYHYVAHRVDGKVRWCYIGDYRKVVGFGVARVRVSGDPVVVAQVVALIENVLGREYKVKVFEKEAGSVAEVTLIDKVALEVGRFKDLKDALKEK